MRTLLLAAMISAPSLALAQQGTLQLGVTGGRMWIDELTPLASAWQVTPSVAWFFTDHIAAELEVGVAFGRGRVPEDDIGYTLVTPRLNLYGVVLPEAPIEPYIVAGPGAWYSTHDTDEPTLGRHYPNPNLDFLFSAGPGLAVPLTRTLQVRSDVRILANLGDQQTTREEASGINWEWNFGLSYRFGTEPDTDGDRFPDSEDACPEAAEDLDGFEDEDGCPEADNDKDGLTDQMDTCPNEPEDLDAWEDDDGCPDPDNDGDGVLDSGDACPNVAGLVALGGCPDADEDGLTDDDDECPTDAGPESAFGCPDADADAVPDYRDACPEEPLPADADTYRSTGCATRVYLGEAAVLFSEPLAFTRRDADLQDASKLLLDDAAALLSDYVQVTKLEVVGFSTDGEAPSKARAEKVLAYLVEKGVAAERLSARSATPEEVAKEAPSIALAILEQTRERPELKKPAEDAPTDEAPAEDAGE